MIRCIPTNSPLDELFGNGIMARTVTQVYGPPGSGKSNIAMQALVNCVRMGKKAVFIDPEGSFSPQRLEQMAPTDKQRVLDNTYLFEPSSLLEQAQAIAGLEEKDDIALIIVDSIVYYYRLEMDRENPHGSSKELGLQVAQLLDIARKKNIAVLITNQVYTDMDTGEKEPVGGDILKYGSKIIIKLEGEAERRAKIIKHQFKKAGETRAFRIVGSGII